MALSAGNKTHEELANRRRETRVSIESTVNLGGGALRYTCMANADVFLFYVGPLFGVESSGNP